LLQIGLAGADAAFGFARHVPRWLDSPGTVELDLPLSREVLCSCAIRKHR